MMIELIGIMIVLRESLKIGETVKIIEEITHPKEYKA